MASGITPDRSTTPPQDPPAKRARRDSQDSSSDTDFSSIVAAALNPPQDEDLSTPAHVTALRDNMNVHTHITGCMHSLKGIRAYIQAMALCQEARSNVGAQIASPRVIVNTFTEYCADNPRSFLALVCRPALDRILRADPTRPPADALNQVLSDYLGRPLPDGLRIRELNAFINELEELYQSQLHRGYEAFFRNLLSSHTVDIGFAYTALEEPEPISAVPLTLEDIARIIRKCHEPRYAHLNILNRNNLVLSIPQNPLSSEHLLPISLQPLALLTNLQTLTVLGVTGTLNLPRHPELNSLLTFNSRVTAINLSHTPAMHSLNLNSNELTEINLSHTPAMRHLSLTSNQLTTIDLSHNPQLEYLELTRNRLTEIDLSRARAISKLLLTSNQLTTIDLSHNPQLEYLELTDNQLTEIDLSRNPQLKTIHLRGNPNLRRLDVRNNPMMRTVIVDRGVEVLANPEVEVFRA